MFGACSLFGCFVKHAPCWPLGNELQDFLITSITCEGFGLEVVCKSEWFIDPVIKWILIRNSIISTALDVKISLLVTVGVGTLGPFAHLSLPGEFIGALSTDCEIIVSLSDLTVIVVAVPSPFISKSSTSWVQDISIFIFKQCSIPLIIIDLDPIDLLISWLRCSIFNEFVATHLAIFEECCLSQDCEG